MKMAMNAAVVQMAAVMLLNVFPIGDTREANRKKGDRSCEPVG